MQSHQSEDLASEDTIEDAFAYLDQVKETFGKESEIYRDFLVTMTELKSRRADGLEVIMRVSNLFRGHPDLIVGLRKFVPSKYRIEVQPNGQVQVTVANLGQGSTGITTLIILPNGAPSTSEHATNCNHSTKLTSPHSSSANDVDSAD